MSSFNINIKEIRDQPCMHKQSNMDIYPHEYFTIKSHKMTPANGIKAIWTSMCINSQKMYYFSNPSKQTFVYTLRWTK